jgi:hypothetical protein
MSTSDEIQQRKLSSHSSRGFVGTAKADPEIGYRDLEGVRCLVYDCLLFNEMETDERKSASPVRRGRSLQRFPRNSLSFSGSLSGFSPLLIEHCPFFTGSLHETTQSATPNLKLKHPEEYSDVNTSCPDVRPQGSLARALMDGPFLGERLDWVLKVRISATRSTQSFFSCVPPASSSCPTTASVAHHR